MKKTCDLTTPPQVDPLTGKLESIAIRIARETNFGYDPHNLTLEGRLNALKNLSRRQWKEEYVSTLIALLPLDLREAAAQGWDRIQRRGV